MAHGTPDWWGTGPKATTYALQDLAELAVRLGSVNTYDRRGDVMWWDDWSSGLGRVEVTGTGVGYEVYLEAVGGRYQTAVVCLKTGNAANDLAGLNVAMHYPVLGGIGAEVSFVPHASMKDVRISVTLYVGDFTHWFYAAYKHTTGQVQIMDDTGAWVTIGTPGQQREGEHNYSTLKVVINAITDKYARVLFNNKVYSVSGVGPSLVIDPSAQLMRTWVLTYTNEAAATIVKLGHLIVTQNEPL